MLTIDQAYALPATYDTRVYRIEDAKWAVKMHGPNHWQLLLWTGNEWSDRGSFRYEYLALKELAALAGL